MSAAVHTEELAMVDPAHMRHVMGHVPTSVAVVCTVDDGEPVGCTIGSFVSVSLDPALVAFFGMDSSSTLCAIRRAKSFTVNVLAHDQAPICDVFARKDPTRFQQICWEAGRNDNPRLAGALAVLDCDVESITATGDHQMILGRVLDLSIERPGMEPLVFARGALRGLAEQSAGQARHPFAWLGD